MSIPPIGGAPATDEIDLAESVAGEEDPGASVDMVRGSPSAASSPGRGDQPAGQRGGEPGGSSRPMSPGDQAPEGTPGTGENVCPDCGGSGQRAGRACPTCEGTGKVTVGIGGS